MKDAKTNVSTLEKVFLDACGVIWRVIRFFDPKPIQAYFAGRVNVTGENMLRIYSLGADDAKEHIARINNNRMKDGEGFIAKRGELIKIFNPENGKFVFRYAQGGGEMRLRYKDIGIDYDAKLALGILSEDEVDLKVMKANAADREFYLMYQDANASSRQSRSLGWYILLAGLVASLGNGLWFLISQVASLVI